ncbi:MAG: ABC transporter permease subunit [Anaerolineales bacterium]|nr:ABC transporter permease subunit [Anaerolineales bacterium]
MTANATLANKGRPAAASRAREGSPWTGLWAVIAKEMADHLTSARMRILEFLIVLTAAGTVYGAMQSLKGAGAEDRFLFLRLYTTSTDPLPAFVGFLGFLVPLIAIGLAFDSINGEFNRRTLSRLLAQPIYRDALLLGKFLGQLGTLSLVLSAIWLLIFGLGLLGLGVPPSSEEVWRSLWLLLATIFYGGIWLALALVCSVVFRQPATAALAAIAAWLFFTVFWGILGGLLARVVSPVRFGTVQELVAQAQSQLGISRLSPNTLYAEIMVGLLNPGTRSLGLILPAQLQGALLGAPLPLRQSLLLIWPQMTGLIAVTLLLFALAYALFQRQEIRA